MGVLGVPTTSEFDAEFEAGLAGFCGCPLDREAKTLSSLLMNVSMSSFVIPMAAAAVK